MLLAADAFLCVLQVKKDRQKHPRFRQPLFSSYLFFWLQFYWFIHVSIVTLRTTETVHMESFHMADMNSCVAYLFKSIWVCKDILFSWDVLQFTTSYEIWKLFICIWKQFVWLWEVNISKELILFLCPSLFPHSPCVHGIELKTGKCLLGLG